MYFSCAGGLKDRDRGLLAATSYQIVKYFDAEDEIQALYGASLLNKRRGGKQVRRE